MEFKRTTKGLRERSSFLSKVAAEKKVQLGWENMKTHYDIYIENEDRERIWEETVLAKGTPTVERTHRFLDIIEKELEVLQPVGCNN
jgi:hypothetical protein